MIGLLAAAALSLADVTVADERITEASGLAVVDGYRVTTNDSGDAARIFVLDRQGRTVGVTTYADEVTDVEALAPAGDGEVWVADVGDNEGVRGSVRIYRVPVAPGIRLVEAPSLELILPVATDVETLLADPRTGRLHLVTKRPTGGVVWAVPVDARVGQTREVRPITTVGVWATDGAVLPDGRHVVLRDYLGGHVLTYPDFEPVGTFALPPDRQGEAIAALGPRRVLTLGEGASPRLRETRIPAGLVADESAASPSASASGLGSTESAAEESSERESAGSGLTDYLPAAGAALVGMVVGGLLGRRLLRDRLRQRRGRS